MKTICFLNNKGGVGKSVSVITIAHMMASRGLKVLLVDIDPQGNSSNLFSEIDSMTLLKNRLLKLPEPNIMSVGNLFVEKDVDIHECIKKTDYENLDIIPSLLTLSEIEEQLKADIKTPQQFRLKRHFSVIKDEYDYCLIDCSPSINILNINALVASDSVYVPILCEAWSAIGMTTIKNLVELVQDYNEGLVFEGYFFTQWSRNRNVNIAVYNMLAEYAYDLMIPLTIARSKLAQEMTLYQAPIMDLDKNAREHITRDYLKLMEYIISNHKKELKAQYKKELDESIKEVLIKRAERQSKLERVENNHGI